MADSFDSLIDFDVIAFAKQLMAEIDGIRSYTVGKSDSSGANNQVPNESRLNAFYRLIGFPMFVTLKAAKGEKLSDALSNVNHLTPGYVTYYDKSEHPLITGKITVEDSEDVDGLTVLDEKGKKSNLKEELFNREATLILLDQFIGTEDINKRMINAFYYPMSLTYFDKKSTSVIDGASENPKERLRYKKIIPFVTMAGKTSGEQPLWDIYPKSHTLSKPFVLNPKNQMIDSNTTLRRPFIESVIRIRMVGAESTTTTSDGKQKTLYDEIKTNLKKEGVYLPDDGTTIEAYILNKMILSLKQLAKKWIEINNRQQKLITKKLIQFSPETSLSKTDPMGKRSFKNPTLKSQAGTVDGQKMLKIKQAIDEREAIMSLLPTDDAQTTKTNGNVLVKNISNNALTSPFISILNSDLEFYKKQKAKLQKEINEVTQQADKLRYEMEMMTGEFLGLSICDIVCIIISLFAINKNYLIALLDPYVQSDMAQDSVFKTILIGPTNITAGQALTELEKTLESVYDLLNKEIEAFGDKTKRVKSTTDLKSSSSTSKVVNNNVYSEQRKQDLAKSSEGGN